MIEVKDLTKKYGEQTVVNHLSFSIENGHVYGFLGPNGAGKSTTMNIMTGCLAATSGEVSIDGHDIFEEGKIAKKQIGYLPEIPPLYIDQTPLEYLEFVAEAKGILRKNRDAEIDRVIAETHIEDVTEKLIKHLSKGYRQRVGIAQALLGNPEMIILDEPTVGLDPQQILEIRDLIRELGKTHTVILSSHILSEVQALCDKILIIHKGNLVAFEDTEKLADRFAGKPMVEIVVEGQKEELESILTSDEDVESVNIKEEKDGALQATVTLKTQDNRAYCAKVTEVLVAHHMVLYKVLPVRATLEDIFLELTNAEATEAPEQPTAPEATEASEQTGADEEVAE